VFQRFPFSLIYRVTVEAIEVIAIAHHRRRPGYWMQR
jgi:toxin ParE1/3/4